MEVLGNCSDSEVVKTAAKHLLNGKLVAFPTETVYGLGANAMDVQAVRSVFHSKRRPFNDPVIVHVPSLEAGLGQVDIKDKQSLELFEFLGKTFWPGPLTIVAPAASHIDSALTAGTGYVGVRVPRHAGMSALMEELTAEAKRNKIALRGGCVPLAGPSANKFTHTSAVRVGQVLKDFKDCPDTYAIDGGRCDLGLESTMVEIHPLTEEQQKNLGPEEEGCTLEVVIIRCGMVTPDQVREALNHNKDLCKVRVRVVPETDPLLCVDGGTVAGASLRHYSPNIDAFIISKVTKPEPPALKRRKTSNTGDDTPDSGIFSGLDALEPRVLTHQKSWVVHAGRIDFIGLSPFPQLRRQASMGVDADAPPRLKRQRTIPGDENSVSLDDCIVIDICGKLKWMEANAMAYTDMALVDNERNDKLGEEADPADGKCAEIHSVARNLYDCLHWAERHRGAKALLVASLADDRRPLAGAIYDRLFRAVNGNTLTVAEGASSVKIENKLNV